MPEPKANAAPMPDVRWNLIACTLWIAVALVIAVWAPWIPFQFDQLGRALGIFCLAITIGFGAWNLWVSLRIVNVTGRALWALPVTICQLGLFTLWFYQVYRH
jgi:uncharacterized membrane protein